MYYYRLYKHIVHSDLRLSIPAMNGDELLGEPEATIRIRLHEPLTAYPSNPETGPLLHEFIALKALDVGIFAVSKGTYVDIYPVAGVADTTLEMWLLGCVMAVLMYQRGYFILHACGVKINGRTVGLIGNVGFGKSTLTASLIARGHVFIADDVLTIDYQQGTHRVYPGFPLLKLSDEIAKRLGFKQDKIVGHSPNKGKSIYSVQTSVSKDSHQLDHLFLLDRGQKEFISIPATASFVNLTQHSLPTRWGYQSNCRHFQQCALMSKQIPLTIFRRPFELNQIDDQVDLIERYLDDRKIS